MELIESKGRLIDNDGTLIAERTQAIPDEFMDTLKQEQDDFHWRLNGFTKVASVPQALVDKWIREGFDIYAAPAMEIIKRLKAAELDLFVTLGNRKI